MKPKRSLSSDRIDPARFKKESNASSESAKLDEAKEKVKGGSEEKSRQRAQQQDTARWFPSIDCANSKCMLI
jgi:hypothetical protein